MGEEYCIIPDHKTVQTKSNVKTVKAAVLAHLFYEEQVDYCRKYLERIPDSIDVIIFSSKQGILNRFQNDRYIKIRKQRQRYKRFACGCTKAYFSIQVYMFCS